MNTDELKRLIDAWANRKVSEYVLSNFLMANIDAIVALAEADIAPANIERAAQALAEYRDPGGVPWEDKMEVSRENWREAVRVVIEALGFRQ